LPDLLRKRPVSFIQKLPLLGQRGFKLFERLRLSNAGALRSEMLDNGPN
jgi:hypothetical protein